MAEPGVPDALSVDLESTEFKDGEARGFWRFVGRKQDIVHVRVYAWDGDAYLLELACDQYRAEPILGRFVDPETLQCVSEAWPQGDGAFGGWFKWQVPNLFICWPGDRGGIAHHPEWRGKCHWKQTENSLVQYLEFIRQCLNVRASGYKPRARQTVTS